MEPRVAPASAPPVITGMLGLLVLVGCEPAAPPRPVVSGAARATAPAVGLRLPEGEPAELQPGKGSIVLSGRFLSAPRGSLDTLVSTTTGHVLDVDSRGQLEERTTVGEVIDVSALSLQLPSGQGSHAVSLKQAAFIRDFRLVGNPGSGQPMVLEPIIATLDTGSILDADVAVEGGEIVLRRLEPQLVLQLGSRACVFSIPGVADEVPCEEPVLIKAFAASRPLRLAAGSALLLPLEVEVQQYTSQARALGASFRESYRPSPPPAGEGPRDFFLLLTVSLAAAGGESRGAKEPR